MKSFSKAMSTKIQSALEKSKGSKAEFDPNNGVIETKHDDRDEEAQALLSQDITSETIHREPNELIISVLQAKDLLSGDMFDKCDPFVKITCNNHIVQTRTQEDNAKPIFNERFRIPVATGDSLVMVEVRDRDTLTTSLIGQTVS